MTKGLNTQHRRRQKISLKTRQLILHEAGYHCSNPACRAILTLDIHHLMPLAKEGDNTADNLLALCPNCHALHHRGEIPLQSIRTWKMLQIAMNEAVDRRALEVLLTLEKTPNLVVSGDGILLCAGLIAGGYVAVEPVDSPNQGLFNTKWTERHYFLDLTDRGRFLLDAWKRGDQAAAVSATSSLVEVDDD
ncbi:MAG: hypothetical protein GTO45_09055 [Candidatus Aminicenantes bacterium]|nr:hypothetical protein [Candidatus Aminicenantes bacterium]NIM78982.1 hypothetical protein [Candidatus Aminicenantes bacterium]NIN18240.1 hypothetical protein [Candidatus Aminicenantes bacterium]NIN42137.1 hypothetical protein [Candidatus Aminicenantes bacterium]NIN84893.1 hypothetical protein [Candidatus Aminicenantes bacterium]